MQNILNWIQQLLGENTEIQSRLLASIVAIVFLIVVRRIVLFFVYRQTKDVANRYHWRKNSTYIIFALSVFVVGGIWFRGFQYLSTYLGLVSAGIAIALQSPIVNLASWVFIVWRKPFIVGDRIQIGEVKGDVIDQRIFAFAMMEIGNWVDADQSTGRIIYVPNGKIFTEPLANYTDGFQYIWNEIPVLITFESNWEKAKEILTEIANTRSDKLLKTAEREIKQTASKKMIYLNKLTPIVYTSVKDSGVLLTLRFLCNPRKRRSAEQELWEGILHAFGDRADIDFAYPTQRHYLNHVEGKEDAKADFNK